MNRRRIIVVGSTNTDLVVNVPRFPAPGETVLGSDLRQVAGGKGANQAVAAARLGGDVAFIARVGDDDHGRQTLLNLQQEGIDSTHVQVTPGVASGVALISIQPETGENSIVVAPGANACLTPADVLAAERLFSQGSVVVVSLEIPPPTVYAAIELGKRHGCIVILNPAPAQVQQNPLLAMVDVITPNEQEATILGGTEKLLAAGVDRVVTTLGARGARIDSRDSTLQIEAPQCTAVDTVGAGDCFTGALAVELARDTEFIEAVRFAVAAASLKVTRHGAQSGMPRRDEVLAFM